MMKEEVCTCGRSTSTQPQLRKWLASGAAELFREKPDWVHGSTVTVILFQAWRLMVTAITPLVICAEGVVLFHGAAEMYLWWLFTDIALETLTEMFKSYNKKKRMYCRFGFVTVLQVKTGLQPGWRVCVCVWGALIRQEQKWSEVVTFQGCYHMQRMIVC